MTLSSLVTCRDEIEDVRVFEGVLGKIGIDGGQPGCEVGQCFSAPVVQITLNLKL